MPFFATMSSPARLNSASILASSTRNEWLVERPRSSILAAEERSLAASSRSAMPGANSSAATVSASTETRGATSARAVAVFSASSTCVAKSVRCRCRSALAATRAAAPGAAAPVIVLGGSLENFALLFDNGADKLNRFATLHLRAGFKRKRLQRYLEDIDLVRHQAENARKLGAIARRDALQSQIAGKWIQIGKRRPCFACFDAKGQQFGNLPHQVDRIVAIEEATGMRFVGNGDKFSRLLLQMARNPGARSIDQVGDPLRLHAVFGCADNVRLGRLRGEAPGSRLCNRDDHRLGVFAGLHGNVPWASNASTQRDTWSRQASA